MHREFRGPRAGRGTVATATVAIVVASWLVVGVPAQAATSSVSIRSIPVMTVHAGAKAVVKPSYAHGKRVSVRAATISVRTTTRWVARGVRSTQLPAGTYRLTTKVSFRVRSAGGSLGRTRSASRTQTLRVVQRPAVTTAAPAPQVPTQPVSHPAPADPVVIPSPAPPQTPKPTPTPSPTATPTPADSLVATGAACDASSLRKSDGTAWECSFADEFDGTSLDTGKWMAQLTSTTGYSLGGACFVDDPANISVGDGVLALSVRQQPGPCAIGSDTFPAQYTGGMVSTWHAFDQTYGRFEIRAAFPRTDEPGLQSALWLYPQKESYGAWPLSGEIDIAEMFSTWPDRAIPYVHSAAKVDPANPVTNEHCLIDDVSQFHTYTVEWTSSAVSIAYDGRTCLMHRLGWLSSALGAAPFDQPFIVALTQGLGVLDNAVTERTPAVGTTTIDYVRVWK